MKISFIILAFLLGSSCFAETGDTSVASNFFANYEEDWSIVLGFGQTSTSIDHSETSNVTNFSALGASNKVKSNTYSLSVMKEFMHQNRLSFTGIFMGGMNQGGGDGTENSISFNEELDGMHFGVGASVNYNYFTDGMKLQPYVGINLIQEKSTYEMKYTSGSNAITTTYDYTGTMADINIGIRVMDPDVDMMSFFNISYINPSAETIDAKANVDGAEGIMNVSKLAKSNIFVSLGFGFIF